MPELTLTTPDDALELLRALGAPAHLVRHHALVVEAADLLIRGLEVALGPPSWFSPVMVRLGAALHDAGKIVHPEELHQPGHAHEPAGRDLLLRAGVAPELAAFCVSHAAWRDAGDDADVLLVALADHLWKGRRNEDLEKQLVELVARTHELPAWDVFVRLDTVFEQVAADGPERLRRSAGP
jgi:hypothetical protein